MTELEQLRQALKRVRQIGDHDHTIAIPEFIDTDDTEQLEAFESGAFEVLDMIKKALEGVDDAH